MSQGKSNLDTFGFLNQQNQNVSFVLSMSLIKACFHSNNSLIYCVSVAGGSALWGKTNKQTKNSSWPSGKVFLLYVQAQTMQKSINSHFQDTWNWMALPACPTFTDLRTSILYVSVLQFSVRSPGNQLPCLSLFFQAKHRHSPEDWQKISMFICALSLPHPTRNTC